MLTTIGLVILAIILIIGTIRIIFRPYSGFLNTVVEFMMLDCLGDILGSIFEALGEADW